MCDARTATGGRLAAALATGLVVTLLIARPPSATAARSQLQTVRVEVDSGETLSTIAERWDVTVEKLRRWNRGRIQGNSGIRAGQLLEIRVAQGVARRMTESRWKGHYQIERGDALVEVAREIEVSVDDLKEWNDLDGHASIRAGDTLVYYKPGERPDPHSAGRPTDGGTVASKYLGEGEGYRLRFPDNAYGMPRVLQSVRACAERVAEVHPGTADILVGDISEPGGGRFPPHQSHQSGRDVDIGYYIEGNEQNDKLRRLQPDEIDYDKTWDLLSCFLVRGRIVRVYMDRAIQEAMADYLREQRIVEEELLDRLFAVERRRHPEEALVWHAPKHDTHIHLRFACGWDDERCREEPEDEVFDAL